MGIKLTVFSEQNIIGLTSQQKVLLDFDGVTDEKRLKKFLEKKRNLNHINKTIPGKPHPFLKWAGGKRQLLKTFHNHFPEHFGKFIEPFVGGGAVFFYLLPDRAILLDINEELINCFNMIKNHLDELIQHLKLHKNEKEYFYMIRSLDRDPEKYSQLSNIERASRTIYLNRCCFNGLYRVNSKGQFNVPFGKYKNPKFCDAENLRAVSFVLQNVKIISASFEKCVESAEPNDFIYFDPPYHPISKTSHFTSYTKDNFGIHSQEKLFRVFKALDKRGCKLMLSNSYSEFIHDLYEEFKILPVLAKRVINSKARKRGKIKEVLILNYDL